MVDPGNVLVVDDVRAITGRRVVPRIATRADVEDAIRRQGRYDESVSNLADMVGAQTVPDEDLSSVQREVEDAPIVKFVNLLVTPGGGRPRVGHPRRARPSTTCASGSASTACCTR